jgi:hypothetical protein
MHFLALASAALLFTLACGGKQDASTSAQAQAARMDTEEALEFASVFLAIENDQNSEEAMPGVVQSGDALALAENAVPACVTRTVLSPTSVKFHYENCTGPRGGTVNGDIVISWTTDRDHFTKTYQQFILARNGKTWTAPPSSPM